MQDMIAALDENLVYMSHQIFDNCITIRVNSDRNGASCPSCGQASSRIHSTYERSFQDLPIQGKQVYVVITNRKYFCDNPGCQNTTFAESFSFLKPKAKKSNRLIDEIMKVSLEVSSVTASRLLGGGVAKVCKSTICDMIKKNGRSVGQGKDRARLHR